MSCEEQKRRDYQKLQKQAAAYWQRRKNYERVCVRERKGETSSQISDFPKIILSCVLNFAVCVPCSYYYPIYCTYVHSYQCH